MEAVPSNPDQLGPVSELVALPVPQSRDGGIFYIRLIAPPLDAMLKHLGGLPGAGRDSSPDGNGESGGKGLESLLESMELLDVQARALLGEVGGATEPAIAFDAPETGKLFWTDLHFQNRRFILTEMFRLAGVGPGRADAVGTFPPVNGGGGATSEGSGSGVEDGSTTAPVSTRA